MFKETRLREEEEGDSLDIGTNTIGASCSEMSYGFVGHILEIKGLISVLDFHRRR